MNNDSNFNFVLNNKINKVNFLSIQNSTLKNNPYELTGYRPLTMEQGLDFDPEPFIVPAKTFLKTGAYTEYPSGTKPFRDY